MKLVAVISVTVFIYSAYCGTLNRTTKKHGLISEENVKSLIENDMQSVYQPKISTQSDTIDSKVGSTHLTDELPLDNDLLEDIFKATDESPSTASTDPLPAISLESDSVDPTDDSALDNDILKDIFGTTYETPSTTSTDPIPATSLESDSVDPTDDSALDNDILKDIFGTTDETPSTTSTDRLLAISPESDPMDPTDDSALDNDILKDIFGTTDKTTSTTSKVPPPSILIKSRFKDTKEEDNDTFLNKDTLDDIFQTSDESPSTTSSDLPPTMSIKSRMKGTKEKRSNYTLLDEDTLDDIFQTSDESPSTTSTVTPPSISIKRRIKDTKEERSDNTLLDEDTLDDIFQTSDESPATTSSVPAPSISIKRRINNTKEERSNDTLLDEDSLDDIFQTSDESPSTTSTPRTSPLLNNTALDKDTTDAIDDIFGTNNESLPTNSTKHPIISLPLINKPVNMVTAPAEASTDGFDGLDSPRMAPEILLDTNTTEKDSAKSTVLEAATPSKADKIQQPAKKTMTIDAETLKADDSAAENLQSTTEADLEDIFHDIFSGEIIDSTTENPNAKNSTFNYRFVDWDLGEPHNNAGTRMNEDPGDNDDKEPNTSDEGKIILTYNVDELDPPLETIQPSIPSRINVNKTTPEESTTTEETIIDSYEVDDSIESATEPIDSDESPDEIKECKYGTPKFPIPELKVKKYAGKDRRRIADIKCEEQMLDVKYNIIDVAKNKLICESRQGYSMIIGGKKTLQKQFPHMGAVGWIDTENQPVFFCGSTLISPRFSVTAAHCRSTPERGFMNVVSPYPKLVRFGSIDITRNADVIDLNIDAFITLPEFDAAPLKKYNDIALIRFTEDIKFSDLVRPACVWHKSMDDLTTGNVTGWGQTVSRDVNSRSTHLRYAEVNILKHDNCAEQINHRKFRHWEGLIDKQFCAGTPQGSGDTCQGDSGGPLQVQEPFEKDENITVYHLVGITSFGFDCGRPDAPGLYTKVNKYLCFIEEHVWPSTKNHFCP